MVFCLYTHLKLFLLSASHMSNAFLRLYKLALTTQYPPKSIVDFRIQSLSPITNSLHVTQNHLTWDTLINTTLFWLTFPVVQVHRLGNASDLSCWKLMTEASEETKVCFQEPRRGEKVGKSNSLSPTVCLSHCSVAMKWHDQGNSYLGNI